MPTEIEEPRTEYDHPEHGEHAHHDEHEFEGGPVKTFLEHLEDLRWVLIKSGATVLIAFVVCLLGAKQVTEVLKYPLGRAKIKRDKDFQKVSFYLGTNRLGNFKLPLKENAAPLFGTNEFVSFQLSPVPSGTNVFLGLVPRAVTPEESEKLNLSVDALSPTGPFIVATKMAFYAGMVIASPFVFYFVAAFVFPALKMMERKYVYRGLLFGSGLFLIGVSFCYFVLLPVALTASVQFSEWMGFSVTFWRAEDYISFVCKFMLGMGLGFELPVVILVLVKIGILSYSILAKGRPYMIVISFILGAVLTTPEVITQVLMAIPLIMLYEITIWIAWYWERQERNRPMVKGAR